MKKLVLLLLIMGGIHLSALSDNLTKDEIVCKTTRFQGSVLIPGPRPNVTNYSISCSYKLNDNYETIGQPTFGLFAHDDNYEYDDEFSLFFMGAPYEFDSFVSELLDFLQKGENGMGKTIGNTYNVKIINKKLYLDQFDGPAYHLFKEKELKDILKKFREYCRKKNIEITR